MKQVKYIFVNETGSQNAARIIRDSHVSDFRHHYIVNNKGLSRGELINKLVHLRSHYPDAKILGLSEINGERIQVSTTMNQLRREMSDR